MKKTKTILLIAVISLLAVGCKTTGVSTVQAEPTETAPAAAMEPTSVPTATERSTPEATGTAESKASVEPLTASTLRYPLLQIADGSSIILSPYDVRFNSSGELTDLQPAYADAMTPQGCVIATDIGGDGIIGDGYLCQAAEGEDRAHFAILFAFEPDEFREVNIHFGSPEAPRFDLPIADGADVIIDSDTEAAFFVPSDTFDIAAYLDTFAALNCEVVNEVGSPEGYISAALFCLGESGQPAATLSVSISESADGSEMSVSVRVDGLSPTYRLIDFPVGALDYVYSNDGTLAFNTPISFEDVYAFYTSENASFSTADCSLVAETGGEAGTSMQFLCTDHYSANYTYDYLITVVISGADNGAAITMAFSEG